MLNIMGQVVKPRGLWLTRSTANGDVISCNVCGYILESSVSTELIYYDEDGSEMRETADMFFPMKYCPHCHSRLLNWRMLDLGDI
jgi:hypothetical protein